MTENNIIYLENIGHFRKWAISAVHPITDFILGFVLWIEYKLDPTTVITNNKIKLYIIRDMKYYFFIAIYYSLKYTI